VRRRSGHGLPGRRTPGGRVGFERTTLGALRIIRSPTIEASWARRRRRPPEEVVRRGDGVTAGDASRWCRSSRVVITHHSRAGWVIAGAPGLHADHPTPGRRSSGLYPRRCPSSAATHGRSGQCRSMTPPARHSSPMVARAPSQVSCPSSLSDHPGHRAVARSRRAARLAGLSRSPSPNSNVRPRARIRSSWQPRPSAMPHVHRRGHAATRTNPAPAEVCLRLAHTALPGPGRQHAATSSTAVLEAAHRVRRFLLILTQTMQPSWPPTLARDNGSIQKDLSSHPRAARIRSRSGAS